MSFIFYENQTVVNGKIYSTNEDVPGLQVEVKNKTTGREVSIYSPQGSSSYSLGGRSGRSVLAFGIEQPGIYELSAGYPQGDGRPEVVLAVGHSISWGVISWIMILEPQSFFVRSVEVV